VKLVSSTFQSRSVSDIGIGLIATLVALNGVSSSTPSIWSQDWHAVESRPREPVLLTMAQKIDSQLQAYKMTLINHILPELDANYVFSRTPKSVKTYTVVAVKRPRVIRMAETQEEIRAFLGAGNV